jgi:hypothetical protein
MVTLRRAAIACLLVAAASGAARAQDRDQRELEAKKDCLGGHADKGIELLADLYAETNDPTYLYNQGRCFEQNGRPADAVTRFREYLRKATLAPDEKADLQKRIETLEAEARPASPAVAPLGPVPSAAAAPATAMVVTAPPESRSPGSRGYRVAGIAVAGVGVASVAFGVVMGLRAHALSNEVTNDALTQGTFSQSKYDDGRSAERYEIVGYSVGAAALLGGGFLYFWGLGHGSERATTPSVTAAVAPGQARVGLAVRF